jgi:uncharacterized protein YbjQ (UPF0145 family)
VPGRSSIKEHVMLISSIEIIPNKRVTDHLGLVQGSTVRAKHAGKDIMAGFKNIFGGELASYTELLQESRDEAVQRMSQQAEALGANAVINVRFATSSIAAGASEILAYGTAVIVQDV